MRYDSNTATKETYKPDAAILQVGWRNAFHQAGRAAAIHLANRQKGLPDVYFQVVLSLKERENPSPKRTAALTYQYNAQLEGGRLIQELPLSIDDIVRNLSAHGQAAFRLALEADVINLLAGPLAEAKYVALCEDKVFNANLVYLNTLNFYGGSEAMALMAQYLDFLASSLEAQNKKQADLFLAAFDFINQASHWRTITDLASYICNQSHAVIPCGELISYLDSLTIAANNH